MLWKNGIFAALTLAATMALATLLAPDARAQGSCNGGEDVRIAEMTWPSAAALAHIHAIVLEEGYGCGVEIVSGDTVPTSSSMSAKGNPDIAPELWLTSVREIWKKGEQSGTVVSAGDVFTGVEGWYIPRYVAEANPGLKAASDVPDYAHLFPDSENPDRGRFYSCPPGWSCEIYNANIFRAFGLEENYELFSPGSGGALDASIARAFKRKEPILFYYWEPTSILGKYDAVQLEMPPFDPARHECNNEPGCASPFAVSFPASDVITGMAATLAQDAPEVASYLAKVSLDKSVVNQFLAWGDDNKAGARETAVHFLREYPQVWQAWVSSDAKSRVEGALGDL